MNTKITPTHVDGFLYVVMAIAASIVASMSTAEAAKFISPDLLFWSKLSSEAIGAGAMALKMFRSTSYANSINGTSDAGASPGPTNPIGPKDNEAATPNPMATTI